MDTPSPSTGQPFSINAPLRHKAVIVHISFIAMAFLICYPIAFILGTRHHRRLHLLTVVAGLLCIIAGSVAGWVSPLATESTMLTVLSYLLIFLLVIQAGLGIHKGISAKDLFKGYRVHLMLGWVILLLAYTYMVVATAIFTESCTDSSIECFLPLAMGSGFLIYGSVVLLHLMNVFSLPRSSTPEYYEGILLILWGIVCFFVSDTPVLGSEWRALNVGLLWFSGGLFSTSISVQTWISALRERNVVNALVICLTGRAILAGVTDDDPYTAEIHQMLGYMFIAGSMARVIQILFRKSPADNLSRMFARASGSVEPAEEDDCVEDVESGRTGETPHSQTTGQSTPCKHTPIFASATVISGLLAAFLSIAAGILFMGANVEWVGHIRFYMPYASTYVNTTAAVAFLWATYIVILSTIYKNLRQSTSTYYEYLGLANVDPSNDTHPEESVLTRMVAEEPPTMRPSQYRAKRRSLLVQTSKEHSISYPSTIRVGGVLPDERQSWSNGSGTSQSSPTSFGSLSRSATPPLPPHSNDRRTVTFTTEPVQLDTLPRNSSRSQRKVAHNEADHSHDENESSSSESVPFTPNDTTKSHKSDNLVSL